MHASILPTGEKCRWQDRDKAPSSAFCTEKTKVFFSLLNHHKIAQRLGDAPSLLLPGTLKAHLASLPFQNPIKRLPAPSCGHLKKHTARSSREGTFVLIVERCPLASWWPSEESLKFPMAQVYLLVAGVMLCSTPACSLGQNLSGIPSQENREISTYLWWMKRIPSQLCLKERTDFKFPWKRDNNTPIQMTQGTCYHHLILQQISNLFNTEESRAAWNNTLLDQLLSRLHHSLEQLWKQMDKDNLACPYWETVVRKYFQGIHRYLKGKEYSLCAWEVVRVKIGECLSLM